MGQTSGGKPHKSAQPGQTAYKLAAGGAGEPQPVEIRTGISDGRFTQVLDGKIQEGDVVVVGLVTAKADVGGRAPAAGPSGGGRRPF